MLVGLATPRERKETMLLHFEEAELLVRTFGGRVFAAMAQNSTRADSHTYIGTGKAQEVADKISEDNIDIVVINDNVKPGQLYTLKKIFQRSNPDIIVWDRVDLILRIFEKHASTAEAKLQIKLADFRHMGPRIYGMGYVLSRQGGGIGTSGIGETNTELMHRHWRNAVSDVRKELNKIDRNRYQQMEHRKSDGLPTISIVGYTNAGKTALFNSLGKKNNLVEDALFATLASSICKFYLPSVHREVYLSDTIGFIENLPLQLIDAFKSTLMETVHADLLLHVIDAADPLLHEKIAVVEGILHELGADKKEQVYVFNKMDIAKNVDKIELTVRYAKFRPQFTSAIFGIGYDKLIDVITQVLADTVKTDSL